MDENQNENQKEDYLNQALHFLTIARKNIGAAFDDAESWDKTRHYANSADANYALANLDGQKAIVYALAFLAKLITEKMPNEVNHS